MANPNDRTILSGIDMSTSFQSAAISIIGNIAFSFQMNWTGSPVGTFSIDFSNDTAQNIQSTLPTKWINYAASATTTSGATGCTIAWTQPVVPNNWVRLNYVAASGSGTLTSAEYNGR